MARSRHIDDDPEPTAGEARDVSPAAKQGEKAWQAALRPTTFAEYIGQRDLIENLRISVTAAREQGWRSTISCSPDRPA